MANVNQTSVNWSVAPPHRCSTESLHGCVKPTVKPRNLLFRAYMQSLSNWLWYHWIIYFGITTAVSLHTRKTASAVLTQICPCNTFLCFVFFFVILVLEQSRCEKIRDEHFIALISQLSCHSGSNLSLWSCLNTTGCCPCCVFSAASPNKVLVSSIHLKCVDVTHFSWV